MIEAAEGEIIEAKLVTRTKSGTKIRVPATLKFSDGRILFLKSAFGLRDEIKAMRGSRWHGHDEEDGRKIWSVEDCPRNRFQLSYLLGQDVYAWFDRDLVRHEYDEPRMMPHQRELADHGLTYHYDIWAAEMGVGKTLAAQKVIECSGASHWYWVGPKTSLPNIERELRRWGFDKHAERVRVEFLTYDRLVRVIDEWQPGEPVPRGVVFDESSRLKSAATQRTRAAQRLADMIREQHGYDGFAILMSGTPSPKTPKDWWSQCEIAWPGFLREGSPEALERRLGFFVTETHVHTHYRRIGWKDDGRKCAHCGFHFEDGPHDLDFEIDPNDFHAFAPSVNEVAFMHERLKGLVLCKHKKDCLDLPDKRYRRVVLKPAQSILRVAKAIADSAPNAMIGMTLLRELSDGFQYREAAEGKCPCQHCQGSGTVEEWFDPGDEERSFEQADMLDASLKLEKRPVACPRCNGSGEMPRMVRIVREVPCPKEAALKDLLEENEETGRIVVFAGFTGSVDRVAAVCRQAKWDVVRCDGRGFAVLTHDGKVVTTAPLDYWADLEANPRVAFVSHPESGGMSFTLVEARMAVYWSNSFKPEYRIQSEDRIHRKGMDLNLGCTIVDLVHLPSDEKVLAIIRENRKLELMTLGEFKLVLDTPLSLETAA